MARNTENRRINVFINEEEAVDDLEKLKKKSRELEKEIDGMTRGTKEYERSTKRLKNVNKRMDTLNRQMKGELGPSMRQLRREAGKLRNQMRHLAVDSEEYARKSKRLKKVRAEISKHSVTVNRAQRSWQNVLGVVKKFAPAILGGAALGALNTWVNKLSGLSDIITDVQKTTELTDQEIEELMSRFDQFDTRTPRKELLELSRIAGKLGVRGVNDVANFVEAADQINVALSEDLGGNAEEAIRQVGKIVDLFDIKDEFGLEQGMLKTGSAINALGAASTANEEFLVNFTKRVAGVAPNAKIAAPEVLGLAATMDILGQTNEVSTTAISKMLVALGEDIPKFAGIAGMSIEEFTTLLEEDANEAFIKVLEGAQSSQKGLAGMAETLEQLGIDGSRAAGVAGVLTNNIDLLREQQALANEEFEKGTSLTEEFSKKNENLAARIEKIGKRVKALFINNYFKKWANAAVSAIEFFLPAAKKQSDALMDQQVQLNVLVSRITDTNVKEEERLKLIGELNKIYPGYLDNLDKEKVSNQQITDRLKQVNEELVNKILLQQLEEEWEEKAAKAAQAKAKWMQFEKQIREKVVKLARDKNMLDEIQNKGLKEQVKIVMSAVSADEKFVAGMGARNEFMISLGAMNVDLSQSLKVLSGLEEQYADAMDITNQKAEERKQLKGMLGIGDDGNGDSENKKEEDRKKQKGMLGIGDDGNGDSENKKEEDRKKQKEAAAERVKIATDATKEIIGHEIKRMDKMESLSVQEIQITKDTEDAKTLQVKKASEKRQKVHEQDTAYNLDQIRAQRQAYVDLFSTITEASDAFANAMASDGEALAGFQFALAKFQIAARLAQSIANAVQVASAPTPDNIASAGLAIPFKIATMVGSISAVIANAKQLVQPPPEAPEFGAGTLLMGPSHNSRSRGMPIVDPETGQVRALVEGGETLLSKKTRENNKPIVDALLHSSMKENGKPIDLASLIGNIPQVNVSAARSAVQMDTGGGISRSGRPKKEVAPVVNVQAPENSVSGQLLDELRQLRGDFNKQKKEMRAYVTLKDYEDTTRRRDLIKSLSSLQKSS